jgi:hypothetical protein
MLKPLEIETEQFKQRTNGIVSVEQQKSRVDAMHISAAVGVS